MFGAFNKGTYNSEKKDIQPAKKMAITELEYYNLCARTLNSMYSGDALALTPCLKAIYLLEAMGKEKQHENILRDYILTKLQGIASECVPQNADIKRSLKEKTKPENSKVVSGRMMAIRADKTNFTDYTKRTEALAEQLTRSLTLEDYPNDKANEMVIDRTIELCRANTTLNIVKSVLSSTTFHDPKDVVAKFIIESRTETNEHPVMAFRANRNNFNRHKNRNNE